MNQKFFERKKVLYPAVISDDEILRHRRDGK